MGSTTVAHHHQHPEQGERIVLVTGQPRQTFMKKHIQLIILTLLCLLGLVIAFLLNAYSLIWVMIASFYSHYLVRTESSSGARMAWLAFGYVLVIGGFGTSVACLVFFGECTVDFLDDDDYNDDYSGDCAMVLPLFIATAALYGIVHIVDLLIAILYMRTNDTASYYR